jgi:hypothetical protein
MIEAGSCSVTAEPFSVVCPNDPVFMALVNDHCQQPASKTRENKHECARQK